MSLTVSYKRYRIVNNLVSVDKVGELLIITNLIFSLYLFCLNKPSNARKVLNTTTVLTCVNCTEHELSCSGRITYKTDKICFRCEAVPDVSVDMFSSHETDCRGKCENCAKTNLPCQFRGIRGNCINCKDQNLRCSGRITYKNDVENSRVITNSC